jgi:aldose 1-epimerase
MPSPSGRQLRLVHGDQEAIVVELGAGLRTYTVGGRPVLDGYGSEEVCEGGRGQALIPWPNRLGDGRFEWDGRELQTALTEPAQHNAIHGLVRWAPWTVAEESDTRVRLTYRLYPQPGWPWILDLGVVYSLSEEGLEIQTTAVNLPGGAGTCPFGVGWHPYLYAFDGLVDNAVLTFQAATAYVVDERGLPVDTRPVAGSNVDFCAGRTIGSARLDQAYTDLARDSHGRATVELAAADAPEHGTRLWMDGAYTHLMVFSGDTLADPNRRRRGLAVEPMTGAPDMFHNGFGTIVLKEGETFEASWGLVGFTGE